ncbi:MAG TPA: Trm112 family protein [Sphingobium sp.]
MTDAIDPYLLSKLVCPLTRSPLRLDVDRNELVSEAAGLAYPVRRGVPVLIVREARRLDQ